jgi:hypothetical protein
MKNKFFVSFSRHKSLVKKHPHNVKPEQSEGPAKIIRLYQENDRPKQQAKIISFYG